MNYSELDDLQLLKELHKSNELAFAALYDKYWRRIYTLALNYLKSAEMAEDIVQDVFLKIWTGRENMADVREFKPYLFVSARNLIISYLRSKVFHVQLDAVDLPQEETLLPELQLGYKESLSLLHKAVEQLPPQQQLAYKLSRNEGMTYQQIADQMGISRLTVRTHISKALHSIKRFLSDRAAHPAMFLILLAEIKL